MYSNLRPLKPKLQILIQTPILSYADRFSLPQRGVWSTKLVILEPEYFRQSPNRNAEP